MTAQDVPTLKGVFPMRNFHPATSLALAGAGLMFATSPARAVPSFAAQTGQPCTACHIGAFGPQLTPFGRAFKIGGFTQDGGEGLHAKIPFSAMVLGSFNNTAKSLDAPASAHFGLNNNFAIDQVSLFFGHRINDYMGALIQATYNGVNGATADRGASSFSLDNTDIRVTAPFDVGDNTLRLGVTFNNNPTVQDPYHTTFAWGVPYVSSQLAPAPANQPLLAGNFGGTVMGANAYAWWNNALYGELGIYRAMDQGTAKMFGTFPGLGTIDGVAPYGRVAYEWNFNGQTVHIGALGMMAAVKPNYESGIGTDKYADIAVDASYQYLGDGTHTVTVQGIALHERQQLDATLGQGGADRGIHSLDQIRLNATYFYQNTYGLTAGVVRTWGTSDATYYGTRTGRPNSTGLMLEADWVPFGKDDSWMNPLANLKIGLQYTAYTEFDGAVSNYDGTGRNARNNNTIYLFAWTIF
jgi:hypothetical protein